MDPLVFTILLVILGIAVLYVVIKYAVKSAIQEAHAEMKEKEEKENE